MAASASRPERGGVVLGLGAGILSGLLASVQPVGIGLAGLAGVAIVCAVRVWKQALLVAVVLSFMVPKMGTKVHGIPINPGNLLYLILVGVWLVRLTKTGVRTLPVLAVVLFNAALLIGVVEGAWMYRVADIGVEFAALAVCVPLALLVSDAIGDVHALRIYIAVLLWTGAIVAVYGLLQVVIGANHIIIPGITAQWSDVHDPAIWNLLKKNGTDFGEKLYSTYQNGNLVTGFLGLVSPVALGLAMAKDGRESWWLWGVAVTTGAAIVLSLSRGGVAGFIVSLVVLMWLRGVRAWWLVGAAGIVAAVVISHDALLMERLFNSGDLSLGGRLPQYAGLASAVALLPVSRLLQLLFVGVGLGSVSSHAIGSVESVYLDLWIKVGVLGLGAYVWIQAAVVAAGLRNVRQRQPIAGFVEGAIAGLIGVWVHGGIDFLFFLVPTQGNVAVVSGMVLASAQLTKQGAPVVGRDWHE